MNDYQRFIAASRYARWLEDKKRRETWEEVVGRYTGWMSVHISKKHDFYDQRLWEDVYNAIHDLELMPSMRCLMTAGEALERNHIAGYNCAYLAVDDTRAFDEAMMILMCGTGVGFSVERQYVEQLPVVGQQSDEPFECIMVADSAPVRCLPMLRMRRDHRTGATISEDMALHTSVQRNRAVVCPGTMSRSGRFGPSHKLRVRISLQRSAALSLTN